MRTAVFSARRYDRTMLAKANEAAGHALRFIEDRLAPETAALAEDCEAVSVFVNDNVDAQVLALLAAQGTRLLATRSTGYNHIDTARPPALASPWCGSRTTRPIPWPSSPSACCWPSTARSRAPAPVPATAISTWKA